MNPHAGSSGAAVYHPSIGHRISLNVFGIVLFVFGMGFIVQMSENSCPAWQSLAIGTTLAGWGLFNIASAVRYQLVLADDYVEHRKALGARRLALQDIAGYRLSEYKGTRSLELQPMPGTGKRINLPLLFPPDQRFHDWLGRIKDLDERETNAALKAASSTEAAPGYVERKSKVARELAVVAIFVAVVLALFFR